MKKMVFCILVALCLLFSACAPGQAAVSPVPSSQSAEPAPNPEATPKPALKDDDPAVFTVPLLEKWVRQRLNKPDGEPILVKDLDRITAVYFAGSKAIVPQREVSSNEFGMGGVKVGDDSVMGWDFYDLNDFAQFRNLRHLTVAGQQVTDISGLGGLPLEELNLTGNHIADLSPLAGMDTLNKLVLSQNPVEDLAPLAALPALGELDISRTNVADLSPLAASGLHSLNASQCAALADLAPLGKLSALDALDITGISSDLSFLRDCKNIVSLFVSDVSQEGMGYIEGLPRLDFLELGFCGKDDLTAMNLPAITSLQLNSCTFDNLAILRGCANLKNLYILRLPISAVDVPAELTKLETIEVLSCNATDVSALASLPELQNVTIPAMAQESFDEIAGDVSWAPSLNDQVYTVYELSPAKMQSKNPFPRPCAAALAEPAYVPVEEAGGYNRDIITDALLTGQSTLPDASNGDIPYWTGMTAENKGSTDDFYVAAHYWFEEEVRFLSENGFNFYRAFYDFSNLSEPGDPERVNLRALEEIDQLIAWGMQYGVHIQISLSGLPGYNGTSDGQLLYDGTTRLLDNPKEQQLLKRYWELLARRYADIPNKYLDFELMAEPSYRGQLEWEEVNARYYAVIRDIRDGIWQAEGSKGKESRRIVMIMTLEAFNDPVSPVVAALAADGCVITQHTGIPHWIGGGGANKVGHDEYTNQSYLPDMKDITWPVLYLPQVMIPTGSYQPLTLRSESAFPAGTKVTLHAFYDTGAKVEISADGEVLLQTGRIQGWTPEQKTAYSVTLEKPTADVVMKNTADVELYISLITVEIPGRDVLRLVPHSFFRNNTGYTDMPTITIDENGTASGRLYDAQAVYDIEIAQFLDKVKAAGGEYMLTEIGGGGLLPLSLATVVNDDLFSVLQQKRIPWSGDCLWDVLQNAGRPGSTFKQYGDTPWFYDYSYIEALKKYAAGATR